MNKKMMLLVLFLSSFSAFAKQSITLPMVSFQVSADYAMTKFDQVISNPEKVLRRYRPAGVKVSNKRVAGNEISFTAIKTVLLITKSVYVHGVLEISEVGRGCAKLERAYSLKMYFESSDRLVTDNVDELRAVLCLREDTDAKVSGQIKPVLIKGERYSNTLGPIAVNLIKAQVSPILNALTEEIKSMK